MIKWTRLQLGALPIIAIEADSAIQKLEELVAKVNSLAINDDIQALNSLRQSILNRIQMLDRFYEQNYLDSTISIFHMIKLKLKKAVFNIPNINNDTVSIELMNLDHNKQIQNLSKIAYATEYETQNNQNKFKVQIKRKSKSKSLKSKDNILKLLQTSRRQEEDTNLMQEVNNGRNNFFDHSFDFNKNQDDEPLFKTYTQTKNEQILKKNNKNLMLKQKSSLMNTKDKSLSPVVNRTQRNQANQIENLQKSPFRPNNDREIKQIRQKGKVVNKAARASELGSKAVNNQKKPIQKGINYKIDTNRKISAKKEISKNMKMKTEGEQIRIMEEQKANENPGQFRFTIKMTKQEYLNLLKMKEMMKKGMIS